MQFSTNPRIALDQRAYVAQMAHQAATAQLERILAGKRRPDAADLEEFNHWFRIQGRCLAERARLARQKFASANQAAAEGVAA